MHDTLAILSCNNVAMTRLCLERVARGTHFPLPAEIVVVDNGSTDGSREWLDGEFRSLVSECGLGFTLIANDSNLGCSSARNQALEAARGEFVTFLDNDVEPAIPSWLGAIHARFASDQTIGIVGGLLLYPPVESGDAPRRGHFVQCASVGVSKNGRVAFIGRGEPLSEKHLVPHEAQCLISACMAIRREIYVGLGGFDEAFNPVQFEDFDLCYRYRSAGWMAFYEPKAVMFHHESTTTGASPRNASIVIRNGLKFKKRWRDAFSHEAGPSDEECRWRPLPN